MPPQPQEIYRPQVGQIGSQLDITFNMFDGAVLNPDAVYLQEYERMLADETIAAAYEFLVTVVISLLGEYQHENRVISDFVRENLERMSESFQIACEDILTAIWAGFSVTELCYRAEGMRLYVDYLATYHPTTIWLHVDERGRLAKIRQMNYYHPLGVDIPVQKTIVYTFNKRFNNYYGSSAFKRIRKNWILKDAFLKMWGRALDKFGTPLLVAIVPDSEVKDPETGEMVHQLDYAIKILQNIQNNTALALCHGGTKDNPQEPDIKSIGAGTGVGEAFDTAIKYLNKACCRGLLVPSLVFDEGARTGSYAMGYSHFETFMTFARGLRGRLAEALLDQFVGRLIDLNFGSQKDYGNFHLAAPTVEEVKVWAEVFNNLVNAGALDPAVDADFREMRARIGFSQRSPVERAEHLRQKALKEYPRYLRGEENEPE